MAVSARTAYAMAYQTGIARRYFLHNELPRNLDMVAVKEHYKELRIAMVPMSEQFYNWQHLTPRANLFRLLVLHLAIAQELGEAGCESSGFYKILERKSESLLRCIGDAYLRRGIYNKAAAIAQQGLGAVLNSVQGEIKRLRQAIKDKEQRESSKTQENAGK